MKKAINKIIGLFSLGLLIFAASTAYAKEGHEEYFKDAWQFMKEHAADGGAQFRSDYGTKEDFSKHLMNCGDTRCSMLTHTCLNKIPDGGNLANIRFICVEKEDKGSYIANGWNEVSDESSKQYEKNCYGAKEGSSSHQIKTYCVKVVGDTVEVRGGEKADNTCDVVEVSWYNKRKCTFCSLLGVVYAVAEKITIIAYDSFVRSFAIVIVVGLVIWIAFKTLAFVSDLSKQDAAKFITELMTQSFKFLISFFALLFYDQIFEFIIIPILRSGMNFSSAFVNLETLSERFGEDIYNAIVNAAATSSADNMQSFGNKIPSDYIRNADNRFFDVLTYATIENVAHNVNIYYSLLQAIGESLFCIGSKMTFFLIKDENATFAFGLVCMIYGAVFFVFGILLGIAVVFYLLDAIVQIGIVGGILPFLVACWPFKITSKYTKKGFDMLLNSIFIFVMIGVVAKTSMELISVATASNIEGDNQNGSSYDGFVVLITAISSIDSKTLHETVNIFSVGFLMIMMANMMALTFLKKVSEFANKFSSGAMPQIAPGIMTQVASTGVGATKKLVKGGLGSVAKGIGEGFMDSTEEVRENIKSSIRGGLNYAGRSVRRFTRRAVAKVPGGRSFLRFHDNVKIAKNERINREEKKEQDKQQQNNENINDFFS